MYENTTSITNLGGSGTATIAGSFYTIPISPDSVSGIYATPSTIQINGTGTSTNSNLNVKITPNTTTLGGIITGEEVVEKKLYLDAIEKQKELEEELKEKRQELSIYKFLFSRFKLLEIGGVKRFIDTQTGLLIECPN
jgi:hypothetical protein